MQIQLNRWNCARVCTCRRNSSRRRKTGCLLCCWRASLSIFFRWEVSVFIWRHLTFRFMSGFAMLWFYWHRLAVQCCITDWWWKTSVICFCLSPLHFWYLHSAITSTVDFMRSWTSRSIMQPSISMWIFRGYMRRKLATGMWQSRLWHSLSVLCLTSY